MHDWDYVQQVTMNRMMRNSPIVDEMIAVRDRYNGDYVLPYLSQEELPTMPQLTPAVIADAVDNNGMRASSVMPSVNVPALNPAKDEGVRSREYAKTRRKIITACYYESRMNLLMRKAFRHLFGYATFAMTVTPDFKKQMPRINVRDPLTCYPDDRAAEDFADPIDIAFVYAKSAHWIRDTYPQARNYIPDETQGETLWEMVEWTDADDVVIGILGPKYRPFNYDQSSPLRYGMELSRFPNRVGFPPAIVPCRVTLDRISSQLTKITGITDIMSLMTTLDVIAREKSIFPDRYILGRTGATPQLVGGQWKDGRDGEMNIVLDAEKIGAMTFAPDQASTQTIDRLERNFRISAGLVPQMGGESYGALRTGRGMDSLMSASVDPRIQEMQEVMQAHLPRLNEAIFETYKAYWPDKKFVQISGWLNDRGRVEFTPSTHIETTDNTVTYPIPGTDAQGMTIILGQLLGTQAISRKTFRERHPYIGDAEDEAARVDEETFERAATESIIQQAMQGQLPLVMLAEIEKARREDPNGDIFTAIREADRVMRERQATEAPEPEPGQVTAPEAQPGLAAPQVQQPTAVAGPAGTTIGPSLDLNGLRELMNATAATNRRI